MNITNLFLAFSLNLFNLVCFCFVFKVDATATGVYNSREVSGSANLKYKIGGGRHEVAASMAQTGSLEDTLALTAAASFDR
jgi:hypothetical protein